VSEGVGAFKGAPRRFERVGEYRGADVVIDYAHLPAEIAATLRGARESGYRDPVVVFQPHRYTRTLEVGADFAPAFDDLDLLVVTDIYGAGETNPTGVTGEFLVEALLRRGRVSRVLYARDLAEAAAQLEGLFSGDLLLLVGAGDVPTLATLLGASA
jgi:UDP-N-acetylmuramate--alanine ligase